MNPQLRSELLKQRTTRTARVLLISLVGVTLLVVSLHVFTIKATSLSQAANQPKVFGWGTSIGALFAALAGGIGLTAEFRYGTIRPTLLANPHRTRVLEAKATAAALIGLPIGLLSAALVAALGSAGLSIRGIPNTLDAGDFAQLILGGAVSAAVWAVLGTAVGGVVRSQVGTVVGLCVWLLLVENILIGNVPAVGKYAPGASGGAFAGLIPNAASATLLSPAIGALLLIGYAALTFLVGRIAFERRDID
jgi:ABC-2 type transport system permease protein